jgi:hypothetical protein
MSTKSVDCGGTSANTKQRKCLSCDIPAFCRGYYYRGKLLTERDFTDEQRYFIDKMRLHQRALHGWGVVCGLMAHPHPQCPSLRLVITEGLAIDDCGREVRVLENTYIDLPQPPPEKTEEPCPGDPPVPPDTPKRAAAADDDKDPVDANESSTSQEGDYTPPEECCEDSPGPMDLYLWICYAECETELAPAPFDECGCDSRTQKPNRICEGYDLHLSDQMPDWWDKANEHGCDAEDCDDYYREALGQCADTGKIPCVPLAIVHNFVPGQAVTKADINNRKERRQLASADTLDHVLRCVIDKLPTEKMTRIDEISWVHGRRVLCRDFTQEFIGAHANDTHTGFQIKFDSKVYSDAINSRTFQAMVVYRPESPSDPRLMEIAPALIDKDPDETAWCRLRIDPTYARHRLDGRNFDLYITLRCNVITGKNGLPVDGNFLAVGDPGAGYQMKFPTGDNIAGGTFESWIRVRPRAKN